jgi:hypothetical protein
MPKFIARASGAGELDELFREHAPEGALEPEVAALCMRYGAPKKGAPRDLVVTKDKALFEKRLGPKQIPAKGLPTILIGTQSEEESAHPVRTSKE